jgi:hypothetical protein
MPAEFAFYSTDIDPTTDPAEASPPPDTLIQLDQDPIFEPATYDPTEGPAGRGSVLRTLGGAVVQQFDAAIADRRIVFSDVDALNAATVAALQALYDAGSEFYFTDGFDVWKCRFEPGGLKYRRNMRAAHHGLTRYAYEIRLVPTLEATPSGSTTTTTTTEA